MYPIKSKSKEKKLSRKEMEVQFTPWHLFTMEVFQGLVEKQLKKNIEFFWRKLIDSKLKISKRKLISFKSKE